MKTVIIGGSSGMGLATAKMLHEQGHQIVIASRSKEKLEKASEQIGKAGTFVLDMTKEEQISNFFSKVGFFNHLVISAADFIMGPITDLPTETVKHFFDSKFWGQYCAAKYGAPKIKKGGSITFFAGIASQRPLPNFAAGSAINGAIESLTRALAIELSPIRVNAISPGTIVTPVWETMPEKERTAYFKEASRKLPAQRVGQPEDVAQAVKFLIECGYATGSIVYVDGGDRLI